MKNIWIVFVCLFQTMGCTQPLDKRERPIGGSCESCDLMFEGIPSTLSWETSLTDPSEPGEPMIISGVIFKEDGKTPAPNIILYLYQTDNKGLYSKAAGQTQAVRHGHIRGWVKSNAKGEYQFKTIRPASYPNSNSPQHIHPIIYEPAKGYYWIDEYQFEDDPLLTSAARQQVSDRGGSGIIKLNKTNGTWQGKRDIILGFNVRNY